MVCYFAELVSSTVPSCKLLDGGLLRDGVEAICGTSATESEDRRARYRKSLAFFSASGLLVSIMFYATTSMLFFGAFLISHRLELDFNVPRDCVGDGHLPVAGVQTGQRG